MDEVLADTTVQPDAASSSEATEPTPTETAPDAVTTPPDAVVEAAESEVARHDFNKPLGDGINAPSA